MKKIILFLLLMITAGGAAHAFIDKYSLDRKDLPEPAREMLDKYFPKAKVGMIKVDRHLLRKADYEVRLVNGTTIKYNSAGKWKSVDCKKREVPEGLVIKTIRIYVSKNCNGAKIVRVEKKSSGYVIGLSDDVELNFNLLGQLKKMKMEE